MDQDKIILGPGDVCTLLQIKESTLRKYALILQSAGYHFDTNAKGQRAYYEKDVIAIRKLIEIKSSSDMTLEQSANAVMTWFEQSNMSLRDTNNEVVRNRYDDDIKELKNKFDQQNSLLAEMLKLIDQQQKQISQQQNQIDEQQRYILEKRDQILIESIRESQKQHLLEVAAAHEEEQKKPKKGWFGWLSK